MQIYFRNLRWMFFGFKDIVLVLQFFQSVFNCARKTRSFHFDCEISNFERKTFEPKQEVKLQLNKISFGVDLSQFFDSLSVILTSLFSRLIYGLRLLVMLRFFTHATTKILIFSNLLILAINIIQSFFNSFSIIIHSRFQQFHKLTF